MPILMPGTVNLNKNVKTLYITIIMRQLILFETSDYQAILIPYTVNKLHCTLHPID